jgi:hypothetical protein
MLNAVDFRYWQMTSRDSSTNTQRKGARNLEQRCLDCEAITKQESETRNLTSGCLRLQGSHPAHLDFTTE